MLFMREVHIPDFLSKVRIHGNQERSFSDPHSPSSIRCCLADSRFSNWDVRFPDTFGLKGWWCGSNDLSCHLPGPNENILWELRQQIVFITCSRQADVRNCCASFLCHLSATGQPCRQLPTCSPGSLWPAKYLPPFTLHFFSPKLKTQVNQDPHCVLLDQWVSTQVCAQPWCLWEHRLPPVSAAEPSQCPVVGWEGWMCCALSLCHPCDLGHHWPEVRMIQDTLCPSLVSTWPTGRLG